MRTTLARPGLIDVIGHTPMTWINGDGCGYWAKLEAYGPGGMKARAAVGMLAGATARGDLKPGAPIVESTSGTLGIGLTTTARALGHPVVLVVDDELEPDMRALLRALGARLEIVDAPHPIGGWQRARLDRLATVLADHPDAYWPCQYDNPDNAAGYVGMAAEILTQIERADVLVASVGSGGHCAGLTRALRHEWPGLRVIGVDAVGSRIFGQPDRPRFMRGLGSSILPRNVVYRDYDEVHWVGAVEAVAACRRLAVTACVAGGWSTGAAALVAEWVARENPSAEVLTVFPDGPHRYLRTIYDDAWCESRGLLEQPVTEPRRLDDPASLEVQGWGRCCVICDPAGGPA